MTDSVVGVSGNSHLIGDTIGDESISLTDNELPYHRHYCFRNEIATTTDWSAYSI